MRGRYHNENRIDPLSILPASSQADQPLDDRSPWRDLLERPPWPRIRSTGNLYGTQHEKSKCEGFPFFFYLESTSCDTKLFLPSPCLRGTHLVCWHCCNQLVALSLNRTGNPFSFFLVACHKTQRLRFSWKHNGVSVSTMFPTPRSAAGSTFHSVGPTTVPCVAELSVPLGNDGCGIFSPPKLLRSNIIEIYIPAWSYYLRVSSVGVEAASVTTTSCCNASNQLPRLQYTFSCRPCLLSLSLALLSPCICMLWPLPWPRPYHCSMTALCIFESIKYVKLHHTWPTDVCHGWEKKVHHVYTYFWCAGWRHFYCYGCCRRWRASLAMVQCAGSSFWTPPQALLFLFFDLLRRLHSFLFI